MMKKNPYYYLGENPTVDLIVINPHREVLMIVRSLKSEACPGMLAFPGGFIDSEAKKGEHWQSGLETPRQAALRELAEETNLILEAQTELTPVGVYVGNKRDPRDNDLSWSKSYAFLFLIDQEMFDKQKDQIVGMDDADEAKWIELQVLRSLPLAFDHNIILEDALQKI